MTHVYEYDVFISYQRTSPTVAPWVRTHFQPELAHLLDDLVDYDVRVFSDDQVGGGTVWPMKLRDVFQRTRILLPVLTPKYFLDERCLAEWWSMAEREKRAGLGTAGQATGLIYPVVFSDSQNFPLYAHERTMRNLSVYAHHVPQFQDSLAFLDFLANLRAIAEELALLLDQVPEWRPDWPVETPVPEPPRRAKLPRF